MSVLLTICLGSMVHIGRHIATHLPLSAQLLSAGLCLPLVVFMVGLLFFACPLSQGLQSCNSKLAKKLGTITAAYGQATSQLTPSHWWLQFAVSTGVWLLFPGKMVILAAILGVRLPFSVLISVTMVSYMMGMFPLTPGGIGTFEGTMLALLALVGVGYTTSLTITLVFRFVTFWLMILAGMVFIFIYEFSLNLKGHEFHDHNTLDAHTP